MDSCSTCRSIPDLLVVNTGRDGRFPDEAQRFVTLDLDQRNDLWRCPECAALFHWTDLSQMSGSGNNDDERLVRLSAEQAAAARPFIDVTTSDPFLPVEDLFRILPRELTSVLLHDLALTKPELFAQYVQPLLHALITESNPFGYDVLLTYCGSHRGRLREMKALVEAAGPNLGSGAEYLLKTCTARLPRNNPA